MRLLRALLFTPLLFGIASVATPPAPASAAVFVSVAIAPPELPIYEQPAIPGPGYMWTPGYWAYAPVGYYWVPGTWVMPPTIGFLWTPGYWGWGNGAYLWNAGYWGPHVGFYGGINYGYGYFGSGFAGGNWRGDAFYYNTAYTNVGNGRIPHVYNQTVAYNNTARVSHNGGTGGINAQPTAQEQSWAREHHVSATGTQTQHEAAARSNPQLHANVNKGNPPIGATPRAGQVGTNNTVGSATGRRSPSSPATVHPSNPNVQGGQPQGKTHANTGQRSPSSPNTVNRSNANVQGGQPQGKTHANTGQRAPSGPKTVSRVDANVQGGQPHGGQPQNNAAHGGQPQGNAPHGKAPSDKSAQGEQKKQP